MSEKILLQKDILQGVANQGGEVGKSSQRIEDSQKVLKATPAIVDSVKDPDDRQKVLFALMQLSGDIASGQ